MIILTPFCYYFCPLKQNPNDKIRVIPFSNHLGCIVTRPKSTTRDEGFQKPYILPQEFSKYFFSSEKKKE